MAWYTFDFQIANQYRADIMIPDDIHPSKHGDYIQTHMDTICNQRLINGAKDVTVWKQWIEPMEETHI